MLTRYHADIPLPYLLYLPNDYDPNKAYPLILFLHGIGERGIDLDLLKRQGLPAEIEKGHELPCIVAAPQCPDGRYWVQLVKPLNHLLNEIEDHHRIDESRVYLTGLSMGGYGAWALGIANPDRFAAIVPICGGGQPAFAAALRDVPIWAFHGSEDPVVPLSESQRMVRALESVGGNIKFTIYHDVFHDSWTQTYADPALYEWLFAQVK